MKLLVGLLAVSMAICATIALPARSPNDEVELVDVPPKTRSSANSDTDAAVDADVEPDFRDFKGVVDTGVGYPFLQPLPHPFSFNLGFFDSFDDILRRLRTRLFPVEFGSDSESSEDGLAVNLDPSKGANTTSVVKVVDGHKIEINDTVYSNGDQSNGAVFKFRVINIRPIDSSEESTPDDARQNPVTSSPGSPNNNSVEGDDTSNERKESKESTEKDENNKTIDNEITKNIDDQESSATEDVVDLHAGDERPSEAAMFVEDKADFVTDNAATTEDQPVFDDGTLSEFLVEEQQIYENPASSIMSSEQLSIDSENVNDANDNDDDDDDVAATSVMSDGDGDGDGDDDGAKGLEIKADTFNESILSEIQNQHNAEELNVEAENLSETMGKLQLSLESEPEEVEEEEQVHSMTTTTHHHHNQHNHSLREDISSSDDDDEEHDNASQPPTADLEKNQKFNSEWSSLVADIAANEKENNDENNDIDIYDSVPIDLSNDIAVNDILADQGAPHNPDAEVFSVDDFQPASAGGSTGGGFYHQKPRPLSVGLTHHYIK